MLGGRESPDPLHAAGDGVAGGGTWSLVEDPARARVLVRFPAFVTAGIAAEATAAIARILCERGAAMVVVVDLAEVEAFEVHAPVAAVRAALKAVGLISRVELIVRRRIVRIAAVSAARILGLPCTVRSA